MRFVLVDPVLLPVVDVGAAGTGYSARVVVDGVSAAGEQAVLVQRNPGPDGRPAEELRAVRAGIDDAAGGAGADRWTW